MDDVAQHLIVDAVEHRELVLDRVESDRRHAVDDAKRRADEALAEALRTGAVS